MTISQTAPPIVHAPLPWYAEQFPVALICAAVGLTAGVLVAWEMAPHNPWALSIGVGLLIFAIFSALGLLYRRSLLRRMVQRMSTDDPVDSTEITFTPELRHVVADLIPPTILTHDTHVAQRWNDFQVQCQRLGTPRPRTVIDSTLAERLGAIDRPEFSVEPESILGSGDARGLMNLLWPLGFTAIGLVLIMFGDLLLAVMMFSLAGFWIVTSVPVIRDRFRIFRWDDGNIVAGMGSLRDEWNRVWTTDNAVMIVQTKATAGALFVRFIGDPGETRLTFTDERDPDFITLWQRWNHPIPRPELEMN